MSKNLFPSNNCDFKTFCEELNTKLTKGTGGRYNKKANWLSAQIASSLPNKKADYNINTLKAELNGTYLMKFRRNRTPLYQVDLNGGQYNKRLTHNADWVSVISFLANHNVLVNIDGDEMEISSEEFQFVAEGCAMHGTSLFNLVEDNLPVLVHFEARGNGFYGDRDLELLHLDIDGSRTALFREDGYLLSFFSFHDAENIWAGGEYRATKGVPHVMSFLGLDTL